MMDSVFSARAPSNIALIKYMGKKDHLLNLPENGSVSMTLDALCSVAEITVSSSRDPIRTFSSRIRWVSERPQGFVHLPLEAPLLDENGISKLIRHAERVVLFCREIFPRFEIELGSLALPNSKESLLFRTANTFPQASGIASSASAFGAITLVTALACARDRRKFEQLWAENPLFREELAQVSRQGSGSSCRSLGGPWVMWEDQAVSVLPSQMPKMAHFVLLVSDRQKEVSSSQAHSRIKTSPLWEKRPERVAQRLVKMKAAIAAGDLPTVSQIAWSESWEMHSLFHTCAEPFSYWEPASIRALQMLSPFMKEANPPIVTLDAGPNIHVIVEATQRQQWFDHLRKICGPEMKILSDQQGTGASL